MWRGTNFPQSNSYHLAASLGHAYRRSGFRLLSDLAWFPLSTTFVGALFVLGLDWRLLILLPLTLTASASINLLRLFRQTSRVYAQLKEFYATHRHWRFTPIPTSEYLESLFQHMVIPGVEVPEGTHELFAQYMLPLSEYYRGDYLRFIEIETDEETAPATWVSFATSHHAWIFLYEHPRDMNEIAHFKVLHEVGHTDPASTTISYVARGNFTMLFASLPVLAIMLKWEPATVLIFGIYLLVFFSLTNFTLKQFDKHARFKDEVFADYFAFTRCPTRWFQDLSAKDIDVWVNMISGNGSSENRHTYTSSEYDAPLTEEQVNWRRLVLRDQISRIQKRGSTKSEEHIPSASFRRTNRLIFYQQMLLIIVSVVLGLQHAPLTTSRFVALVVAMFLLTIVGLAMIVMIRGLDLHWDLNVKAKQVSEMPVKDQKDIETLENWPATDTKAHRMARGTSGPKHRR